MSGPDFERMSKDEVVAWFNTAEDVSPLLSAMAPVSEGVISPTADGPMATISIRFALTTSPSATAPVVEERVR